MRKMADVRQQTVMLGRGETGKSHPQQLPELFNRLKCCWVRLVSWCGNAQGILEQVGPGELDAAFFAAGHRVGADEVSSFWQNPLSELNHGPLRAANIGH